MGTDNLLDRNNIEDILSLTSTQEGMLFHYISNKNSKEYQGQFSLTLYGDIKIELFQKAWEHVIDSNEMLRTIYRWENLDLPIQIVLKQNKVTVRYFDFKNLNDNEKRIELDELKKNDANNIKIDKEALKIILCKIDENVYEMIINNHHIIYDGWSTGIILKEFLQAYNASFRGEKLIKPCKNKFKEFIEYSKSQDRKSQIVFWDNYLKNLEVNEDFFADNFEMKNIKSYDFKLSSKLNIEIRDFSQKHHISVATILYSAWGIILQYLNDANDIIFGTTVSGRNIDIKGIDEIVGLFINTIPLRIKSNVNTTIFELIKKVHFDLKERECYENTSLLDIKDCSCLSTNQNLFNSIVVIENYPLDFKMNDESIIKIEKYLMDETTNYNMTLIIETFEDIHLKYSYNSYVLNDERVIALANYFKAVLNIIINNTYGKLNEIDILSQEEKQKLLYEFNETKAGYSRDKTIHQLFEEQVEKTPNNIAIVFEDKKLTYRELNEKSNRLAKKLRERGVKADTVVGIMVERSLEMMIGIIAILKSGGAYLPIDPEYPIDRITYIIEDSKTGILLTQKKLIENINFHKDVIDLNDDIEYACNCGNLDNINKATDLAYIIYTSGSTGNPKGVMIEHRQVNNFIEGVIKKTNITEYENILCITTSSFDIFVLETILPLTKGLKVVIANESEQIDGNKLSESIMKNNIEIMQSTPSRIQLLMENNNFARCMSNIKIVLVGGEPITLSVLNNLYSYRTLKIYNMYGPTETTVWSTIKDLSDRCEINIGKPIQNTKVFILDKNNRLLPMGIVGELGISGDGVARGYLNREELTREKFIKSQFVKDERIYKTGDLAKWLPDGNIEFLGRIDHQVKIRGFRIELGEIENQLLKIDAIKEAVVIDREDRSGTKYLYAYIVGHKEISGGELREHLLKKLPDYMVPAYFIQLEKIPLTPNGKIDRKSLPDEGKRIVIEYEAPRNEIEENLVVIWSKVLGIEQIGINDNFFELGGHSLKATILVSKIHRQLKVDVPIREIFKSPTIKGVSEYIEGKEKSIYTAIQLGEEKETYEVSSAQKRMYMLQQFDLQGVGYNMPTVMVVEGMLDIERLEDAFKKIIKRHESLRTSFETIGKEIVQKVSKEVNFKVEYSENQNKNIHGIVEGFIKPFDLSKAPLLRVAVVKLQDKHILMFDMHHIISDGVSMKILTSDFMKIYEGEQLENLRIQYKDYSEWQNKFLKSEEIKKQEEYWINRFSDEIPMLDIPTDFIRPKVQSFEGNSICFKLDNEVTEKLKKVAKETGSTMYMVLLSGVNILLSKYSGQEDIIIGSPIAGREHVDLEKVIGMFVNILPMRNYPQGDKKYEEFLKEVRDNSFKAYENQQYQFEELVDKLNIRRDISRNPLFDVMFAMQNMDKSYIILKDLTFKEYKQEHRVSKFDLTFTASELQGEIQIDLEYSTKLFKRETIERMVEHLKNIFKVVVKNKNIKLTEINMLSENEKKTLLYDFNNTFTEYPRIKTIHELFEEQVEKTSDNIAIVCEKSMLTYRELNEKANQLARVLKEDYKVKPGEVVAINIQRSIELMIGIIAVLKANAVCLPIDSKYPTTRIVNMLKDSKAKVVLNKDKKMQYKDFNGEIFTLNINELSEYNKENLENSIKSSDLAYLIYTSGSTGNPKAVMLSHKGINNHTFTKIHETNMCNTDICCHNLTINFVASIWQIFAPLFVGCKLHIYKEEIIMDSYGLFKSVEQDNITILEVVPALLNSFLQLSDEDINAISLKKLKKLLLTGEKVGTELVNKFYRKYNIDLINAYGQSECSDDTLHYHIPYNRKTTKMLIGKPSNNTQIHIIGNGGELQPINVLGELCISGEGVAKGYLNAPELTAEKFIKNPFVPGETMYRSGDMARWLPDGNVEFLGRKDHQVKIRGFRIELGEIESQLLKQEVVTQVVVIDREDTNGLKYLCAYVVLNKEITMGALREELSKKLPHYMIPSHFVQLYKIPLNSNGKVNIKELPELDSTTSREIEYRSPENKIEESLVSIWSEILDADNIGTNDNFFELGGHSLKATAVASKIHKELEVKVPISEIFKNPTIVQLAEYINNANMNLYIPIERAEEKEFYPVASSQKGIYAIQMFDENSISYNIPIILTLEGKVDKRLIEDIFIKLVNRHEAFRTSFELVEGNPIQRIHKTVDFKLDFGTLDDNEQATINKYIRPFDLNKAPLIRAGLFEKYHNKHILIVDIHHIIADGVSLAIIINEFCKLYQGISLSPLEVTYKDFVVWKEKMLQGKMFLEQERYWLNKFKDEVPIINLPLDYPRPRILSFNGDKININLDKSISDKLKNLAMENNSTLYMVMLAAYNILLYKYTGEETLIVGSSIAGRQHSIIENIVGMFINMLPMKNKIDKKSTFKEFLFEVRKNSLEAYKNQEYPFEKLVEKLGGKRDISRNVLFDTIFDVQNMDIRPINLKGIEIKPYLYEDKTSKTDIVISITENKEGINVNIEYNTNLFKKETIEKFGMHYEEIIKRVIENINVNIDELDILTLAERGTLPEVNIDDELIEYMNLDLDEQFNF